MSLTVEGYLHDMDPVWCKVTKALDGSSLPNLHLSSHSRRTRGSRRMTSESDSVSRVSDSTAFSEDEKAETEISDENLITANPNVYGYNLSTRKWGMLLSFVSIK